jgi:hypothetical protein
MPAAGWRECTTTRATRRPGNYGAAPVGRRWNWPSGAIDVQKKIWKSGGSLGVAVSTHYRRLDHYDTQRGVTSTFGRKRQGEILRDLDVPDVSLLIEGDFIGQAGCRRSDPSSREISCVSGPDRLDGREGAGRGWFDSGAPRKLGVSCGVKVPAGQGLTSQPY